MVVTMDKIAFFMHEIANWFYLKSHLQSHFFCYNQGVLRTAVQPEVLKPATKRKL